MDYKPEDDPALQAPSVGLMPWLRGTPHGIEPAVSCLVSHLAELVCPSVSEHVAGVHDSVHVRQGYTDCMASFTASCLTWPTLRASAASSTSMPTGLLWQHIPADQLRGQSGGAWESRICPSLLLLEDWRSQVDRCWHGAKASQSSQAHAIFDVQAV